VADVVVVGAGVIGAACAEALSARGARVTVLDRGDPAAGTTASGEGNVLVSDKPPGPELDLALDSRRRWPELLARLAGELGDAEVEWEAKGGLVVATGEAAGLAGFAAAQRTAGVDAVELTAAEAAELEPHLTDDFALAMHYPQDAQLQPVLAATILLTAVRRRGGRVRPGVTATGVRRDGAGAVTAVLTSAGPVPCDVVLNACGPWAGDFAARAGAPLTILPRRGNVLVTAPLPPVVRHKVYDGDYVGAVGSDDAGLQTSAVVESTAAGTVLIGSSRERVGFDDTIRVQALREMARRAIRLFPVLADVPVMRAYGGFRPYAADHLPVIGPDPRVGGLWHAGGHEGAGIGLAPGTGELIAAQVAGAGTDLDPAPFAPTRFANV
jgi:D-hydroxyproline dehydrogenase subunit beta